MKFTGTVAHEPLRKEAADRQKFTGCFHWFAPARKSTEWRSTKLCSCDALHIFCPLSALATDLGHARRGDR